MLPSLPQLAALVARITNRLWYSPYRKQDEKPEDRNAFSLCTNTCYDGFTADARTNDQTQSGCGLAHVHAGRGWNPALPTHADQHNERLQSEAGVESSAEQFSGRKWCSFVCDSG